MSCVRRAPMPARGLTPEVRVPARVRAVAFNWIVVGRVGTPTLPHAFAVGRARWEYDRADMRLAELTVAALQFVPDGAVGAYLDTLAALRGRAVAKQDHAVIVVADVTRSPELRWGVVQRVPGTILERVRPGDADGWDHPFREVGRALLLSRLHLWFGERRIGSALPTDAANPNLWTLGQVRGALEAARAKAPKVDEESVLQDDSVEDDAVLAVAQLCWWGRAKAPSPWVDDPSDLEGRARR